MQALYLDIILPNDRFFCQLPYTGTPKKMLTIEGSNVPAYDAQDLISFVLSKRPTLKNVDFRIELTNNRM